MITNVNNKTGKYILTSLLILLISSTCAGAYVSFTCPVLWNKWFPVTGFVAATVALIHYSGLLLTSVPLTRLEATHLCLFSVYASIIASCAVIPWMTTGARDWRFHVLMVSYWVDLLPLVAMLVALRFKDSQNVQHWLHPLQELVDGFPKSQSSATTTTTTVANMQDVSTLQQIIVSDASTATPKPSQVFKTWPKGPPFSVKALYSFKTTAESELPFRRGDELTVLDCRGRWWYATAAAAADEKDGGQKGFIPSNYVRVLLTAEVVEAAAAAEAMENEDELKVELGQVVEVMERYDEKCLIRSNDGKIGVISTRKLKFVDCESQPASETVLKTAPMQNNNNNDKENLADSQNLPSNALS